MKIFLDTEFIEDGRTIDLLSIGAIRADGAVFYAESSEADHSKASEWVCVNVLPHLRGGVAQHRRKFIADTFRDFCGPQPEFWGYYADYDWVALCQLYGTMMDLPDGWPMFCRDVKQLCMASGNPELPPKGDRPVHHALEDARWVKDAYEFLLRHHEAKPSDKPHPWQAFLDARADAIDWLHADGKTDDEIARTLSMDGPTQVWLIRTRVRDDRYVSPSPVIIGVDKASGPDRTHLECAACKDSGGCPTPKHCISTLGGKILDDDINSGSKSQ